MPRSRSPVGRIPAAIRRALLPALVLIPAGFVTGGPGVSVPAAPAARGCGSDLMHPLQVQVVPQGPVRPGAAVSAAVSVTARRPLDGVVVRVIAPSDVALLSAPSRSLGALGAGANRNTVFTVIAPRGGPRRTVEVQVEGTRDGVPVVRRASLNLALEDEPARTVTAPDGRSIREVRARRTG